MFGRELLEKGTEEKRTEHIFWPFGDRELCLAVGCPVSYQNKQTVGREVLMSWNGREHGKDEAGEDQDKPTDTTEEQPGRSVNACCSKQTGIK